MCEFDSFPLTVHKIHTVGWRGMHSQPTTYAHGGGMKIKALPALSDNYMYLVRAQCHAIVELCLETVEATSLNFLAAGGREDE